MFFQNFENFEKSMWRRPLSLSLYKYLSLFFLSLPLSFYLAVVLSLSLYPSLSI